MQKLACLRRFLKIFLIYIKDEDEDEPIARSEGMENKLGLYIKVYNQIAVAGYAAPLVLHIADKNLNDGEFWVEKIAGLGHDCSPNSFLYICGSKTRNGCDGFYQWFIKILYCLLSTVAEQQVV
jgi:hypothetical protein